MASSVPPLSRDAGSALERIFLATPRMRDVAQRIEQAASSRLGVSLRGEAGCGRTVAARAIHAAKGDGGDAGDGGSFVTVDCASAAGEELQHRLFGVTPRQNGNGARAALERVHRHSLMVQAHGGTLFLRNLSDMPAGAQSRLARVLRDREAILDNGVHTPLDVRAIVAAPGEADSGLVPDLARRLAAFRIDVPPLRERREDIPAIARAVLDVVCFERGVATKQLTQQASLLLTRLPWRGNLTEMRAVLESVALRVAGQTIRLEHVLADITFDGGGARIIAGGSLKEARARFERDYILEMLSKHHGRIGDAALALGIQRTNLYRKLRGLRVKPPRSPVGG